MSKTDRVLGVVLRFPGATVEGISRQTGYGLVTTTKVLARLERQGRLQKVPGRRVPTRYYQR